MHGSLITTVVNLGRSPMQHEVAVVSETQGNVYPYASDDLQKFVGQKVLSLHGSDSMRAFGHSLPFAIFCKHKLYNLHRRTVCNVPVYATLYFRITNESRKS